MDSKQTEEGPGPVHAAAPLEATPELLLRLKKAQYACLKAMYLMINPPLYLSKFCMCTLAVSRRILTHYSIPFAVRVGYTSMPCVVPPVCFPHVWLETEIGDRVLITDLSVSGPAREASVVGQAVAFAPETVRPLYSLVPQVTVGKDALDRNLYHRLKQEAQDIDGYVSRANATIRDEIERVVAKALDGKMEVEVAVPAGEGSGGAGAGAAGAGPA